jgi:hypothetical protein
MNSTLCLARAQTDRTASQGFRDASVGGERSMSRDRWLTSKPPSRPWQSNPPLPANVTIDLSKHLPNLLPSKKGWEILQRNGRTHGRRSVGMDSAQFGVLCALYGGQPCQSERFEISFGVWKPLALPNNEWMRKAKCTGVETCSRACAKSQLLRS